MVGQNIDSLMPLPLDEAHHEGIRLQLDRDGYTSLIRHIFTKADGTHVQLMGRVHRVEPEVYFHILFPDQETEQIFEIAKLRRDNDSLVKVIVSPRQQVEL